jgi:hypothetical protein
MGQMMFDVMDLRLERNPVDFFKSFVGLRKRAGCCGFSESSAGDRADALKQTRAGASCSRRAFD